MFLAGTLLVAVALPFPQVGGGCSTPSFAEATLVPTDAGDGPSVVAVGDFNLDGKPDLAVANFTEQSVTVRLGDGTGGFPPAGSSTSSAFIAPECVAFGDFNLDGKPDLAVANSGASFLQFIEGNVTIYLGDGTGALPVAPSFTLNVGGFPRSLAIGDLDLDGIPDLAIANRQNVSIRLGDGTGAFPDSAASTIDLGPFPPEIAVAIGDLDLDGKPDLAIGRDDASGENVTIRLGDGTGGFPDADASAVSAGNIPWALAIADLDLDGKPDLVAVNRNSEDVTIRLGDGTGAFPDAGSSTVSVGTTPRSVLVADLNLDGKPDLAVPNVNSSNVTIRLGDGTGGFPDAGSTTIDAPVAGPIAAGDFDLDGKPDLALPCSTTDVVMVLRNTCDALPCAGTSFSQPPGSPWGALIPTSVATGDFDRDGNLDLVVAQRLLGLRIRKGDGTGGFPDHLSGFVPVDVGSEQVVVGDLNLDGKPDLAIVHPFAGSDHGVTIRLGDGTGGFPPAGGSTFDESLRVQHLAIGDVNLDGQPDLLYVDHLSSIVRIRLGDGTGAFPVVDTTTIVPFTRPDCLAIGDLNLDGKPDLVVSAALGHEVALRLGDGAGGFPDSGSSMIAEAITPTSVAIGDLNRDGKPDLAVTLSCCSASVMIFLGDGAGGFPAAGRSSIVTGIAYDFVAIRDLDLDGKLDLALVQRDVGNVTIRLGDGNGGFPVSGISTVGTGAGPISIVLGDWNQDGLPDLAAANYGSNNLTIQLNTCTSNQAPVADAGDDQTVECSGGTTQVTLDGSGSSDADLDVLAYSWSEGGNEIATGVSPTVSLAMGSHTITLTVSDPDEETSTDLVSVVVADTTAPVITLTTGDIILRRPHHRYVEYDVTAFMSGASDGCDSAIDASDVVIASVSSDEPENANGNGDGNTVNDIVLLPGCRSVKLRHERAESLNGRVYSVTLAVRDAAGNLGTAVRKVQVPVGPGTATDDGAAAGYTVGGCNP